MAYIKLRIKDRLCLALRCELIHPSKSEFRVLFSLPRYFPMISLERKICCIEIVVVRPCCGEALDFVSAGDL